MDLVLISVLFFQDSQDLLTGSLFNYSIYKYKHYRWQKRILQVMQVIQTSEDISPKEMPSILCSISCTRASAGGNWRGLTDFSSVIHLTSFQLKMQRIV